MPVKDKVSILVPVYNMEKSIDESVKILVDSVDKFFSEYEIILSNDGSCDNTHTVLKSIEKKYQNVIVVNSEVNHGKGHALKRAFEYSSGRYIAFCDADMELHPSQLENFFNIMEKENVDIVIGSKRHPSSSVNYSLIRKIISFVYFAFVKIVFDLPIHDTQTGLKLFKREALSGVFPRILVKAFAYDIEVLAAAYHNGYKIAEAPVAINPNRNFGFIALNTLYKTFIDTLAIFYRLSFLKFYDNLLGERKTEPLVSIIIPLKNINDYIVQCVSLILKQTYKKYEIIILPDFYEKEDQIELFNDEKIKIVPTGNMSPALKRHKGAELSNGEALAFIDDDTYPEANWLENAVRLFDTENINAIGGVAVTPYEDSFFQHVSGMIYSNFMTSGRHTCRYIPKQVQYVNDYPSCNFIMKRDLYFEVGGFDTNYYPGEDTLLCNNVIKNREKIIYTPDVLVYHHRRKFPLDHIKQVSGYGFHRGMFARRIGGNSLSLSYFIPSLFVIYLFSLIIYPFCHGALSSFAENVFSISLSHILPVIFFAPLALYGALLLASWISTLSLRKGFFMTIGIFLTHIVYGISFLKGFFKKR